MDLKEAKQMENPCTWRYGLYALFLKNNKACRLRYGMQDYDYQEGTVVTFASDAEVILDYTEDELSPDATGLLFHPDLTYISRVCTKVEIRIRQIHGIGWMDVRVQSAGTPSPSS